MKVLSVFNLMKYIEQVHKHLPDSLKGGFFFLAIF